MFRFLHHTMVGKLRLIGLPTILFLFLASAEARFDFHPQDPAGPSVTTVVKYGEGLGQIVRDLGLKPNWQNKQWITDIKAANPQKVDGKDLILNANEPIKIPLAALQGLEGHQELLAKYSTPVAPPVAPTPEPIAPPQESPMVPPVESAPIATELDNSDIDGPVIDLYLMAGLNFLDAANDLISGNEVALVGSEHMGLGLEIAIDTTESQRLILQARPRITRYAPPSNIDINQDNNFLWSAGLRYSFEVATKTHLRLVLQAATRKYARFNGFNVILENPVIPELGFELLTEMANFGHSGLWLSLTPLFLAEASSPLRVDAGFGGIGSLTFQPGLRNQGFIIGLEYQYYKQNPNRANQQIQAIYAKLGYRF